MAFEHMHHNYSNIIFLIMGMPFNDGGKLIPYWRCIIIYSLMLYRGGHQLALFRQLHITRLYINVTGSDLNIPTANCGRSNIVLGGQSSTITAFLTRPSWSHGGIKQQGSHYKVDSGLAPSQWEASLQSNIISHWPGAFLESALHYIIWRFTALWPRISLPC